MKACAQLTKIYSAGLHSFVQDLRCRAGGLTPVNECDIMGCAVITYDRLYDHIGWHYDNNYYSSESFYTVLVPLEVGSDSAS